MAFDELKNTSKRWRGVSKSEAQQPNAGARGQKRSVNSLPRRVSIDFVSPSIAVKALVGKEHLVF